MPEMKLLEKACPQERRFREEKPGIEPRSHRWQRQLLQGPGMIAAAPSTRSAFACVLKISNDSAGIRTPAGRAQWISGPLLSRSDTLSCFGENA